MDNFNNYKQLATSEDILLLNEKIEFLFGRFMNDFLINKLLLIDRVLELGGVEDAHNLIVKLIKELDDKTGISDTNKTANKKR